jgi:hypothetical protein
VIVGSGVGIVSVSMVAGVEHAAVISINNPSNMKVLLKVALLIAVMNNSY